MRTGSARSFIAGMLVVFSCGLPATAVGAEEADDAKSAQSATETDETSTDADADEPFFVDDIDEAPAGKPKLRRGTEIGVDVLIVRPLSFATLIVGAGFVYPASVLAAPNSMSVRQEVVDVFWTIPLENLTERELGEI